MSETPTDVLQIGSIREESSGAPPTGAITPPPSPPATPPMLGYSGGDTPDVGVGDALRDLPWGKMIGEAVGAVMVGGTIGALAASSGTRPFSAHGFKVGAYAGTVLWSVTDLVRSFKSRHWSVSLVFAGVAGPSAFLLYRATQHPTRRSKWFFA